MYIDLYSNAIYSLNDPNGSIYAQKILSVRVLSITSRWIEIGHKNLTRAHILQQTGGYLCKDM